MNVVQNYEAADEVILDGVTYRLARPTAPNHETLPFKVEYVNEPPWDSGEPPLVSQVQETWHLGGFKSREGISGTSEYGVNNDARFPFRLLPAAKRTTIALPGDSTSRAVTCYLFDPYYRVLYVAAGPYVYGMFPDSPDIFLVANFGSANVVVMKYWRHQVYVVTSDTGNNVWSISNFGHGFEVNKSPTGAGASTGWTPSAGANWQNVDDAPGVSDGDVTYNSTSTLSATDLFTHGASGIALPEVPSYLGVDLILRRTVAGGADAKVRAVMRIGGVNYTSDEITLTDIAYHEEFFFEFKSPATGAPWTAAEVDAMQFGYQLTQVPGAGVVRVTSCYLFQEGSEVTQSDFNADWIESGMERMYRTAAVGTAPRQVILKNITPDLDPLVDANWGDSVIIPGSDSARNSSDNETDGFVPPSIVAYGRSAIVATETGVYGVSDEGFGTPLFNRIKGVITTMEVIEPWLYLGTRHGFYRYQPGIVQTIGLESEILNQQTVVRGPISAITSAGKWILAAIKSPTGTNHHIMIGRDATSNEQALGPMVWDTFIQKSDEVTIRQFNNFVGFNNGVSGSVFLGWNTDKDFEVINWPGDGGASEVNNPNYSFGLSWTRYTNRFRFTDWGNKLFPKFIVAGKGLDVNTYVTFAYSIDNGAWQTLDINGAAMVLNSTSRTTFYLPSTAVGREIQFRLVYTGASSSSPGEINFFEPFARPRPRKVKRVSFALILEAGQSLVQGFQVKSPQEQFDALQTCLTQDTFISATGPWQDGAANVQLVTLEQLNAEQVDVTMPSMTVQAQIQMMVTAS